MSDPMTNTDVEDVLASIRRLVSDTGRPSTAKVKAPPSDRLVLTPSLRVPEAESVEEKKAGPVQPVQQERSVERTDISVVKDKPASSPLVLDEDMSVDDDLSVFARTAFRKDTVPAEGPKDAEAGPLPEADALAGSELDAAAGPEIDVAAGPEIDAAADIEEDVETDVQTDIAPEVDSAALADTIADIALEEEAPAAPEPSVEPTAADPAKPAPQSTAAEAESDEDASDAQMFEAMSRQVSEAETAPANLDGTEVPIGPEDWEIGATDPVKKAPVSKVEAAKEAQQSLSEKIAALEALVGARRDQFEPDDTGADAYAGTEPPAMEWEDVQPDAPEDEVAQDAQKEAHDDPHEVEHSAEDTVEPAQPSVASETIGVTAGLVSGDDDVLDEEALRELISDIVREELQGALGERITRNVRKLVRREIHRALAAQDLE